MIWRKSNQPIVSIPILSSLIFSKKNTHFYEMHLCASGQSNYPHVLMSCPSSAMAPVREQWTLVYCCCFRSPLDLSLSLTLPLSLCRSTALLHVISQYMCQPRIRLDSVFCTTSMPIDYSQVHIRIFCLLDLSFCSACGLPIAYWCAWYFVNVRIESEEEQTVFYVSAVQSLEASPSITQSRYQASNLVNWSVAFLW